MEQPVLAGRCADCDRARTATARCLVERYVPGDRYCETRWSIRTLLASLILVRASGPYLVFKVRINAGSMSLAKASQPSRCAVSLVDRRSSKNWWTKCLMYRFLA